MSSSSEFKGKKNSQNKQNHNKSPMIMPREIIPIMAQASDPLGSYTGTAAGGLPYDTPVQDADDL